MDLTQAIRDKALVLGFDAVGFAAAGADPADKANLAQFLDRRLHGDMGWMARHAERRVDPRALWPEARTVVAVAANYAPKGNPLATLVRRDRAAISVYAQGRDYHDVLKKRLKRLAGWMAETHACAVKVFVDTAPVMEKP
ncbi:MAG: DUF1730 domain-containing protein, partial [Rhodospirillales bacterium]|nr:DUF1730 domain-containing protein [Rhodospirillales bacterium]